MQTEQFVLLKFHLHIRPYGAVNAWHLHGAKPGHTTHDQIEVLEGRMRELLNDAAMTL